MPSSTQKLMLFGFCNIKQNFQKLVNFTVKLLYLLWTLVPEAEDLSLNMPIVCVCRMILFSNLGENGFVCQARFESEPNVTWVLE